jgi:hypothetical protein
MQAGQYANRRSRSHCLTVLSMKRAAAQDGALCAAPSGVHLGVPESRGLELGRGVRSRGMGCLGTSYRTAWRAGPVIRDTTWRSCWIVNGFSNTGAPFSRRKCP